MFRSIAACAAITALALPCAALAQAYPAKPVKIVVPFATASVPTMAPPRSRRARPTATRC